MKRLLIFVYTAFVLILLANFFYYKNLYNKQINYITALLDRQVQIVGLSVDGTNNYFSSDLNQVIATGDLETFFKDKNVQYRVTEKMKLFYSKYKDFISGIKIYDNNRNEFTLKMDENGNWLEQEPYILHVQGDIVKFDKLVEENKKFNYYLPIYENNIPVGNIVVGVDYQNYFREIFSEFNLKDYQWQWVVGDSDRIIYSNSSKKVIYSGIKTISAAIEAGTIDNLIHSAEIDGKATEVISSYYPTQLLQRNIGLVFSSPTGLFQKYIIRNSLIIVSITLILIQIIISLFMRYIKKQKSEEKRLSDSEKMLFKLIEEMPVGVIILNRNKEIIKANKVAAALYSFPGEEEMMGKILPETAQSDSSEYFAKNLGGRFNPEQFAIIKKETGELVLFRNIIPVTFRGEESSMEILIDVTMLESARKQEALANAAKSEFMARMSYEIRTPLNGIIGITDILNKKDVPGEIREIIKLLQRSTEVLINIINDILDFSKIETGKMILDEVPFTLRDEIKNCSDLARTNIAGNNVVFKYEIDGNIPVSIIADQFRLRQVLTNLINHATSNTSEGEIILNCRLKSNKEGILVLGFELLDTGKEFDSNSLKKIFGDYVNIESKATWGPDESGFGTILARRLVEMMGGELTAESPSGLPGGKGTRILFTINAYSNDKMVKNLDHKKITSFDKINALVISGEHNREEEIVNYLHRLGLNVSVTTYQKSTVGQIKANLNLGHDKYNLVVIIDDEDLNGFDAARAIWENNLSGSLVIFMVSSNDQKGNYMKCVTLGVDHYMVKPVENNELIDAIHDGFHNLEEPKGPVDTDKIRKDLQILIVEDNKMNQKVISTMLKSLGYSYEIAEDGYSGFLQAKSKKYDIIFMDLIMPEMNGYDSARKILAFDKTVVIVAFTADNMPETRKKAELSGIHEFISKPVRMDDLKTLFARHFSIG